MRKTKLFAALFMLCGATVTANATEINVSLDVGDWEKTNLVFSGTDWQGPATVTNVGGNLRGTKTTATPGTNWSLGLHTTGSYDFQGATLRYQWKLNGQGSYAGIYSGLDTGDGHSHLISNVDPNGTSAAYLTTAWSFNGSEVIPSNTWLYTEFIFSETSYAFSVSYTGYGNTDFLHGTKLIAPTTWTALANAHPFFQFGDNRVAGAYFEVAALHITTPAVPEPETYAMMLAGLGLLGFAALRRKQQAA
jgi:hypothetical protein